MREQDKERRLQSIDFHFHTTQATASITDQTIPVIHGPKFLTGLGPFGMRVRLSDHTLEPLRGSAPVVRRR